MREFISIETCEKFETKEENNYLYNCPKCNSKLYSNRYKNLEVWQNVFDGNESIEIAMEYCNNNKCKHELFIRKD